MSKEKKRIGKAGKASYFVAGPNGYIYSGPLYILKSNPCHSARKSCVCRMVFSISVAALFLLCGLIPVPGMTNTVYVILPYGIGLICGAVLLWKSARVSYWGGDQLREYVYLSTVDRLTGIMVACAVISVIALLGEVIYLATEKTDSDNILYAAIFLFAQFAVLLIILFWRRFETALIWEKK